MIPVVVDRAIRVRRDSARSRLYNTARVIAKIDFRGSRFVRRFVGKEAIARGLTDVAAWVENAINAFDFCFPFSRGDRSVEGRGA